METHTLFCFPYAGGSSHVFNKWRSCLHPDIKLHAVELAGRGARIKDTAYVDFNDLLNDVCSQVKSEILKRPYFFFGHSMGCKIAHQLMLKLMDDMMPLPEHLFLSGRGAPHVQRKEEKRYYLMDNDEFRRAVMNLGGTPPEFFQYPELTEIFLPLLKNDFKLTEERLPANEIRPLDRSVTVMLGKTDTVTPEETEGWKWHSKKRCTIQYFEGGHFFLNDEYGTIVEMINNVFLETRKNYSSPQKSFTDVAG
jgi:medium-chain acyl-[acyl-carrier-protein] hydrolase